MIQKIAWALSRLANHVRDESLTRTSIWAPVRRFMPDGSNFSVEDYPYIVGILDSQADQNFICKGAQTGLTEALITLANHVAAREGRDVLYYFPEVKQAREFSRTRFDDAIKYSPVLRNAIVKQTEAMKKFDSGTIFIKGATRRELKSTAASRLFMDELDEWLKGMVALAEQRLRGQRNTDTRAWGFSTPSYPDMGVDLFYQQSTMERYHFDCPHCGERIKLDFDEETCTDPLGKGNLYVCEDDIYESYLKCNCCHSKLDQEDKSNWLRCVEHGGSGHWVPTNPDVDPKLCRGFHVSQLYSPAVEPYQIAKDYIEGLTNPQKMREFYNSVLGLPYAGSEYQVQDIHIGACMERKPYRLTDLDTLPPKANGTMITLGVDQGGPYHTFAAVDWRLSTERVGDCNDRAVGKVVGCGIIAHDDWDQVHGLMKGYHVRQCVIDYFPEPTNARVFARKFCGYVHLCQFITGVGGRELRQIEDEYGADIVKVDRTSWLTKSLGRIHSNTLDLPLDMDLEFWEHLKALKQVHEPRPDGHPAAKYKNFEKPDHFALALMYAEIAFRILDPPYSPATTIQSYR